VCECVGVWVCERLKRWSYRPLFPFRGEAGREVCGGRRGPRFEDQGRIEQPARLQNRLK